MTRIAVDMGNTNTTFGLIADGRVTAAGSVKTTLFHEGDSALRAVRRVLKSAGVDRTKMKRAVIASVVPSATGPLAAAFEEITGAAPLEIGPALDLGIRLAVDEPADTGADRIANGVAAFALHGGPVIVVDFGTATTIDVVDGGGAFLGGAILAGVGTAADALAVRGARLSRPPMEWPDEVIGRSTAGAIRSGMLWGTVTQIDGLVHLMAGEVGDARKPPVIATGGLAPLVAPRSKRIDEVEPLLTLKGLMRIEARNR